MRVYVESNFVLELVLQQSQASQCERLMALAESRGIELVVPAHAVVESAKHVDEKRDEWTRRYDDLGAWLNSLRSSAVTGAATARFQEARDLLLKAIQSLRDSHTNVRHRLLKLARVIPSDIPLLDETTQVRRTFSLKEFDAVILASVLVDARQHPAASVFFTRDEDFDDEQIRATLAELGCTLTLKLKDVFDGVKGSTPPA